LLFCCWDLENGRFCLNSRHINMTRCQYNQTLELEILTAVLDEVSTAVHGDAVAVNINISGLSAKCFAWDF
jgi:hypothetical protein